MRVAGYIRVSTVEQTLHGFSLDAQRELIETYCIENGHKLIGIYADEGKSASKQLHKRTEILRLLDDADAGKMDLIVFKDLSRWSRNPSQFYAVQDRLDKAGVPWLAIEQPNLETVTASGKLIVGIHISVAAHESAQTSERIKFVNASRVKNGGILNGSHLPLGYKVSLIDGQKRMVIDDDMREVVEDVFDTYEREQTIGAVLRTLRSHGIYRTEFGTRQMLKNTIYKGTYHNVTDYCEPYLTEDRWNAIQRTLSQHHYVPQKAEYIFSSLLKCKECGYTMIGTTTRGYTYYVCKNYRYGRCSHSKHMNEAALEKKLMETVDAEVSKYTVTIKQTAKNKKSLAPLKAKLVRLHDLYIDGQITREDHDRRAAEINAEIAKIESAPKAAETVRNAFPNGWQEYYKNASKAAKKAAWRSVIDHIDVGTDNSIEIFFG